MQNVFILIDIRVNNINESKSKKDCRRSHKIEESNCNTHIACLAFEKLASYNFGENVTYRAVSLVGHGGIDVNSLKFV